MENQIIESRRLLLKPFYIEDITQAYLDWLNNPEITNYLEIRHVPQTYERVCEYINSCLADTETKRYWGIFEKDTMLHIGSVALNSIHSLYKTADISFVIGHPSALGKGYATESVHVVCEYAFSKMNLHKITGGHYASHVGSKKVFLKNNFTQECYQREQCINYKNEREDVIRYGLLAKEFVAQKHFFVGDSDEK